MRLWTKLLLAGIAGFSMPASAAPVGYTLDVTTQYQSGNPAAGTLNNVTGGPDTGFFEITNSGLSTFMGTIGDTAVAGNGTNNSFTSATLTLAPGASEWVGIGPTNGSGESSNQGGWNGPTNTVQPGVIINLVGSITDGINSELINLTVNDSQIHSGVPRTNPFGVTLDNYVLQGGDNIGRDTTDAYETTQADGHFQFFEAPATATPLPASAWAGLVLLGGLAVFRLRRRRSIAV